jgi:4-aminobutyrate aminotransferase/(S)-3-amino-2-methylpropionate transaminase
MIVDEVQTGVCLTGTYWAHEQWNLESPPDFVTFAKKMYSCGFYHTAETKMATPMRHHNTYFGDPVRIHLTVAQNELIKEDKLAENATTTGAYLLDGIKDLSKKFPKMMQDPRGAGLMQAFTCESMAQRNALIKAMKTTGIHAGPLSTHVLRVRPTLYFEKKHADLYLDRLNKAAMSIQ